jgi:flavin-binding protein dodecin
MNSRRSLPGQFTTKDPESMSEHTYKMIELVGSSHTSIDDAVKNAVAKAEQDEKSLRWFEVMETRGHIENGKIAHWQVRVKIGATLDG